MKICILTIGDEILIGQIVDTNSAWIARRFLKHGIAVDRIVTIGDDLDEIHDTIKQEFERYDIVITTGGLGPTKDDKTKEAFCKYFQSDLEFHQETYDRLVAIKRYLSALTENLRSLIWSNVICQPMQRSTRTRWEQPLGCGWNGMRRFLFLCREYPMK